MIILDTNVLSELIRLRPEPAVLAWIDSCPTDDLFTTSITAAELLSGVEQMTEGKRRNVLYKAIITLLNEDFHDRIAPFDVSSAVHYSKIVARRKRAGKSISVADAQIAAITVNLNATVATRNIKDFTDTGAHLYNPWKFQSKLFGVFLRALAEVKKLLVILPKD